MRIISDSLWGNINVFLNSNNSNIITAAITLLVPSLGCTWISLSRGTQGIVA
jgi:hypothetical protein